MNAEQLRALELATILLYRLSDGDWVNPDEAGVTANSLGEILTEAKRTKPVERVINNAKVACRYILHHDGDLWLIDYFAESITRYRVAGVSDADWDTLEAGPTHDHYWDTWERVINDAMTDEGRRGDFTDH